MVRRTWTSRLLLALNSGFITVAVILGTGILGLPIKMSKSGFGPFLTTFLLCLFMQLAVGIVFVEILQRADVKLQIRALALVGGGGGGAGGGGGGGGGGGEGGGGEGEGEGSTGQSQSDSVERSLLADSEGIEDGFANDSSTVAEKSADAGEEQQQQEQQRQQQHHHEPGKVDLHSIGALYLESEFARFAFDTVVMMHFISVLVSYGLAGPEAIGNLIGVPYGYLIFPFIVILATIVLVFGDAVQPFVSGLTVFKCIILVVVIGAMGFVAAAVQEVGFACRYEYVILHLVSSTGHTHPQPPPHALTLPPNPQAPFGRLEPSDGALSHWNRRARRFH